jgi:hypothetical protein
MKCQYAHCCFIDLMNYNWRCCSSTIHISSSHQSVTRDDMADIISHLMLIASTHCMSWLPWNDAISLGTLYLANQGRRASGIFDSSNTTKGLLFRKWFYPLYLLGTPHDIFFLLFSAMHFCKVRKIINYLPIHLKTLLSRVTWTLVGQIQCSKRNGIVSR